MCVCVCVVLKLNDPDAVDMSGSGMKYEFHSGG